MDFIHESWGGHTSNTIIIAFLEDFLVVSVPSPFSFSKFDNDIGLSLSGCENKLAVIRHISTECVMIQHNSRTIMNYRIIRAGPAIQVVKPSLGPKIWFLHATFHFRSTEVPFYLFCLKLYSKFLEEQCLLNFTRNFFVANRYLILILLLLCLSIFAVEIRSKTPYR